MKLHLPKLLTAALIAAFVSFTQASGTTLDNAVLKMTDFTQGSIDAANQAGWTLTNVTASDDGIFTSTATQAYITHDTAWTTTTGNGRTPWSAVLTINLNSLGTSGTGVLIESANSPQQAASDRFEGLAYEAAGNQKLEAAWQGTTWPSLTVTSDLKSFADEDGNVTVGVVYKGNDGTSVYVGGSVASNGGLKGTNSCAGNPTIFLGNHEGLQYSNLYLFSGAVSDADMKAMLASMRVSVTWTGSHDSNWDTKTENWVKTGTQDPATFSKKADVTFGADVQAKVVNVVEDATATAMNVTGDYTFKVAEGKALVADGLTLPTGAQTLTFDMASGASTKLVGGLTLAGKTLNLTGAGKATLPNLTLNGGTLNVSSNLDITATGNATVVTSQDGQASTISVQGGTTTVTGGIHFKGGDGSKIEIGTGDTAAKLVTGRLEVGDNQSGASYLTIGANGTLVVTSTNDVHGADSNYKQTGLLLSEWGQQTHTSVAGKLYAKNVNLRQGNQPLNITIADGGEVAVKGINKGASGRNADSVITMNGGKLILGADGLINDGGTWNITLNSGEIGMSAGTTTLARAMNVAGNVTFNTAQYTWSEDGHSISAGSTEGTMTISGNLTGTGSITKTGAGELILSGDANALGNTIQAQGGTLTMTGTFALDGISGGGVIEDFVNAAGETATSGFARKSGTIKVYNEDGGTVNSNAATFTLGGDRVVVTDGVCVIDPTVNYTTLWVKDTPLNFSEYKEVAGATLTTVDLAENASVNMDYDAASVTLALHGDATVNATAATTISSISGWSKELTIGGTAEVTIAGQTLTGTQKLVVDGIVSTTGALMVNSQNASLVVNEDATLNINGNANLSPAHGSVQIDGTVNISHELDLSKNKTSDVQLGIGSTGKLTAWGMWMHSASAITLAEEGELAIGGLSIIGKAGGGITYLGAAGTDSAYGTNNENYKITNATVTSTGTNVTLGNTLSGVDVYVAEGSSLTLNTNADSVTVGNGGTFTLNEGKNVDNITVEDGGTIAGGVDATDVTIKAGATAIIQEGVSDFDNGVYIYSFEGADPTITNNGGSDAKYAGLDQDENMTVTAETLYSTAADYTVVSGVAVTSIMHDGGELTLAKVIAEPLQYVDVEAGALTLQNITEVSLKELSIGTSSTVAVYTDDMATTEGSVTITESLTAGGGTLLADLTLVGHEGGELLSWDLNGTQMTLGSTITLDTQTGLIQLDDATMQQIAALTLDEGNNTWELVINGGQSLGYQGNEWFDGVFSRTYTNAEGMAAQLGGDYNVQLLENGNFGIVKFSNTPEPTTGTLSLLALMALAARRRRK